MAIFSNVNVGSAPNDGTGDSLRTSFTKVNENFQDVLSIWPNISQNELTANITSTYISYFNLIEAETLDSNVLTSPSGNINVSSTNVNISGGNLNVSGTITTSGNLNVSTVNGNIVGTTATFSGNINGTSSNLKSINHFIRSPSGNSIGTAINGGGDAYEFVINETDSVGSTVAFKINNATNVAGTLNATITSGIERTYIIFNPGPSTSNLILPFYPNRTNINTNVVAISGNTTAFIIVRAVSNDIGNVFAQVANI
jgi:hypothetical protein